MMPIDPTQHEIAELFRRESGRLTSVLTRLLGPHNLELAEDVVQESFAAALTHWSDDGVPDNPSAWLLTTARNRVIDVIRRERTRRTFADDLVRYLDSDWTLSATVDDAFDEDGIRDDQLRMIFMCCHESLTLENRITLILKVLSGLSVPAIARALLTTEATINKRLYRTRRRLEGVAFALPPPDVRRAALDTVHTVLYLVFNEGHLSTSREPILRELCGDAMMLTRMLVDTPGLGNADTVALLALMSLNAARLDARLDEDGALVPLDRQDRSRWNRSLITEGFRYLQRASRMEATMAGRYHLEAAIAARHSSAASFAETDWVSICNLYDRLLEVSPSPMTALNRAVAISYRDGPAAAIPMVEALGRDGSGVPRHTLAAVLGNLHARAGSVLRARECLDDALATAPTDPDRAMIRGQIDRLPGA